MTADVKNFYLNTPMDRPEYMRISIKNTPQEIIEEYQVNNLVHEGYVYCKIVKGMYGLPQAGCLANKPLKSDYNPMDTAQHLTPMAYGYTAQNRYNLH
jgi:hypothetical protein